MKSVSAATVPTRISFSVNSVQEGKRILQHLVEERLVSGGTVVLADAVNWVGGDMIEKNRLEVTAYTTLNSIPIIKERLAVICDEEPTVSQFVMVGEKDEVCGWVTRNVRSFQ